MGHTLAGVSAGKVWQAGSIRTRSLTRSTRSAAQFTKSHVPSTVVGRLEARHDRLRSFEREPVARVVVVSNVVADRC